MFIATRFYNALDSASQLGGLHGNKCSVTVKARTRANADCATAISIYMYCCASAAPPPAHP